MTADNKDVNNGSRRSLFRYIVKVLNLLWLYKKTRVSDNKDVNTDTQKLIEVREEAFDNMFIIEINSQLK